MLDTDTYNAHSTAADTLWAGVPVLTMASTRMAGDWGARFRGLVGTIV
jgi:predicted O-linked N-acetylglucosamine transferase (SPINDLY family)